MRAVESLTTMTKRITDRKMTTLSSRGFPQLWLHRSAGEIDPFTMLMLSPPVSRVAHEKGSTNAWRDVGAAERPPRLRRIVMYCT